LIEIGDMLSQRGVAALLSSGLHRRMLQHCARSRNLVPAAFANQQQLKLVWLSTRMMSNDAKGSENKEQKGEEERRQTEEEQRDEEEREQREEILQAGTSVRSTWFALALLWLEIRLIGLLFVCLVVCLLGLQAKGVMYVLGLLALTGLVGGAGYFLFKELFPGRCVQMS
jgi:hypothetical protein